MKIVVFCIFALSALFEICYTKEISLYFIDTNGNVMTTKSKMINSIRGYGFSEGVLPITFTNEFGFGYRNNMGYSDYWGNIVIKPSFYMPEGKINFNEGYAYVHVVNEQNRPIEDGIIDKTGRWIIKSTTKYKILSNISDGLCVVRDNDSDLYGYMNLMGLIVIPCIYGDAEPFYEGVAKVYISPKEGVLGYCFINKGGDFIFARKFSETKRFSEGLAPVTEEGGSIRKWGYTNKKGEIIIKQNYIEAEPFSEGLALVQDSNSCLFGFINKKGNYEIKPRFIMARSFSEGYAHVVWEENSLLKKGYIDYSGKIVFEVNSNMVYGDFREGYAPFRENY